MSGKATTFSSEWRRGVEVEERAIWQKMQDGPPFVAAGSIEIFLNKLLVRILLQIQDQLSLIFRITSGSTQERQNFEFYSPLAGEMGKKRTRK